MDSPPGIAQEIVKQWPNHKRLKMTAEQIKDELIFAGRATLCEYIEGHKFKLIRFSGSVFNRDWEFVRDLYSFLKCVQGACVVDLSLMPDFDATLYTILIWMRILSAGRNVRFLIVATEEVEARLKAAGVGKWMPIIRDISVFHRMFPGSEGTLGAVAAATVPSSPPPAGRGEADSSSRSAA